MIRILPDLDEDLLTRLFHKSAKSVWTSADVDWEAPIGLTDAQAVALGRLLSPVYLGEQSAMIGASAVMPQMMNAGETSAQVYLASFIYDEARHFEALTRLYQRLAIYPAGIREIPAMLRYHRRLREGDRADWVWGILISDLFAKNFYGIFSHSQPEALFGKMSRQILRDESRHQAFADEYLSRAIPRMTPERRRALVAMRDDLMDIMGAIYDRLGADCAVIGIDGDAFLARLMTDIETHSRRIGLTGGGGGPDGGGAPDGGGGGDASEDGAGRVAVRSGRAGGLRALPSARASRAAARCATVPDAAGGCDTCFVAALCQSRLVAGRVTRARRGLPA